MDKRKQFQFQLLSNKLLEYSDKLQYLKTKQHELLNTLIKNNPKDKTIDIDIDISKKELENSLLEQKTLLEARLHKYRNYITGYRTEYTNVIYQIKLLPSELEKNRTLEKSIYNEEIYNIAERTLEVIQEHQNNLDSLEIEKSELIAQIQDVQSQFTISQENISSIQEHSHANRKNTLLELQQKKQQKLIFAHSLDELNKNKKHYFNNHRDISNQLDNLNTLKTDIINIYYSNPNQQSLCADNIMLEIANAKELLPEYILCGESKELLNTIVSYLDKQIQDARYQLSSISKKTSRLEKTITTTTTDIKNKLAYCIREKVISYKDNYKNAKLEKTTIESELNKLQTKLDLWDITVVKYAIEEYKIKKNSLKEEEQRAIERLNIMSTRILTEHENNSTTLANRAKDIEHKLSNTNNLLQQTNLELSTLLKEITHNKSTQIELEDINAHIANVELAIQKIEIDITSIKM